MKQVLLKNWIIEFKKLSTQYIDRINWDTVIWNDGEINQAADDIQADAYNTCYFAENEEEHGYILDVDEWCDYDKSCEYRMDFQDELQEKWDDQLKKR